MNFKTKKVLMFATRDQQRTGQIRQKADFVSFFLEAEIVGESEREAVGVRIERLEVV